ncbi:MAG: hypothetical protein ACRCXZ_04295, partial [Patescibacteria group bacterium]
GLDVGWKVCELNPAYQNIEKIAMKLVEMGMFEELYALQDSCQGNMFKLATFGPKDLERLEDELNQSTQTI